MEPISYLALGTAVGIALGWIIAALRARSAADRATAQISLLNERLQTREQAILELRGEAEQIGAAREELQRQILVLSQQQAQTQERLRGESEKVVELQEIGKRFEQAFQALASKALESNNQSFMALAKTTLEKFQEGAKSDLTERQKAIDTLVGPLKESLQKVDTTVERLAKERMQADVLLHTHVKELKGAHESLREQTGNLARALKNTVVRGRWGELQLRRVVEMAGMLEYCDFTQQTTVTNEDGRLRPDMIINLPNNKVVVVDSKCPLDAYLEAQETADDDRKALKLKEHAKAVRTHVGNLSQRSYWSQFDRTPEFVLLFLPAEPFLGAALEHDPSLMEYGVEQRVLIATPINLIAVLRSVAYGWQQEHVAQNAEEISKLGKKLYDRISTLAKHFSGVGRGLDRAVVAYNEAVSSLESRVLVTARKFKELGAVGGAELEEPQMVDKLSRPVPTEKLIGESDPVEEPVESTTEQ